MTRTFDIVNGHPVPAFAHLDGPAVLERKRAVEKRLGELRGDETRANEREALKRENTGLDSRLREVREHAKREGMRRNFAGLGSPLHEAITERLTPELVAELEAAAMANLAERERRTAERKASKGQG